MGWVRRGFVTGHEPCRRRAARCDGQTQQHPAHSPLLGPSSVLVDAVPDLQDHYRSRLGTKPGEGDGHLVVSDVNRVRAGAGWVLRERIES